MRTWTAFILGGLVYMCNDSLFQDYLGREGYLKHVQMRWVDSSVTVPMAIFGLTAAAAILFAVGRDEIRMERHASYLRDLLQRGTEQ